MNQMPDILTVVSIAALVGIGAIMMILIYLNWGDED